MTNLLFYISVGLLSLFIAWLVTCFDRYLDKKLMFYKAQKEGLTKLNWFLKYELYRDSIQEGGDIDAEKTRSI